MVYARSRKTARLAFCLSGLAGLIVAALALSPFSEASRDRTLNTRSGRLERGFHLRERSPAAAANRMNAATIMPMFASITVDRTDDAVAASACTAAANDCSLRGAVSFANLNPGTTIVLPAGTYQLNITGGAPEGFSGNNLIGDLDITGNNTTITGAGAASTVIQQTQPNDRVIEVNPFLDANFNTTISDVTISGGHETTAIGGGGIISGSVGNSLTITNCVFSGNSATGAGTIGGGGIAHTGGNLTITGTTFSNNSTSASGGAVGYSSGDPLGRTPSSGALSVSGSTFNTNTANSVGGGGGALDLYDFNLSTSTYNVNSSTFSGNHAAGSGGAIIVESGGPLSVTTSALTGNSAVNAGGAVLSIGSASVTYSRLAGNTAVSGSTLFKAGASFTANDNWWGINTGPSAAATGGGVTVASYLQLRVSASPNEICSGQTSTLTADIKQRNTGGSLTTELNGLPTFPAFYTNATLGTVSGATDFVNGVSTATYTAGGTAGVGSVDVTADNQTVTASITVGANDTTDPADQVVCEGATASFTTTTSGNGPITYVWKKGATVLNNGDLGGRVTITNGTNTSTLSISNAQLSDAGTYTVEATGSCNTASQSATLTVNANTHTTDPADQTVCQGTDAHFSTVASGTGPFNYAWTLDGNPVGGNSPNVTIPTGSLSVGNHSVTITTTGACGSEQQTATLTVSSGTPVINLHTTSVTMWPPNHQYKTFTVSDFVSSANAGCGGGDITNSVVIQKVSSDEPEDNLSGGDGNTLNDIVIAADCKSVQLRRERDGLLNGRVYTITFKVTDSFGNSTTSTVKVKVPVTNNGTAVDNGAAAGYTVNSLCP